MVLIINPPFPERVKPKFYTLMEGTKLYRIYETKYCPKPTDFRYCGPMHRFDHHQSEPACVDYKPQKYNASNNSQRGILYVGLEFSCCLVEIFGSTPHAAYIDDKRWLAILTSKKDLTLLDIRNNGAMLVGANMATVGTSERSITQAWSRHFYERTDIFTKVHGIIYCNVHNGEDAIAFYERAENLFAYSSEDVFKLNNKNLKRYIRDAGEKNNITFIFPGDRISLLAAHC